MAKDSALQRIESHEKLCRIMQKQTHEKIASMKKQIDRIESLFFNHLSYSKLLIQNFFHQKHHKYNS